jgi:hypothetical protein
MQFILLGLKEFVLLYVNGIDSIFSSRLSMLRGRLEQGSGQVI